MSLACLVKVLSVLRLRSFEEIKNNISTDCGCLSTIGVQHMGGKSEKSSNSALMRPNFIVEASLKDSNG